MREHWTWITGI